MPALQLQPQYATETDYYNLPENVRAELIDGQIYNLAAPSRIHQEILSALHIKIGNYIHAKQGNCKIYPAPFSVRLKKDVPTIVEPDISIICDRNKLTDKGCTGAPDWIIEIISPSTAYHDYIRKLSPYIDAGVREYWIVNPMNESVYVYYLEDSSLQTASYTFHDIIKVNIYDDFSINLSDILSF